MFIGGLSHSGKTPLRRALSMDPTVAIRRHTGLFGDLYGRFGPLDRPANLDRAIDAICRLPMWRHTDRVLLRRRLGERPASYVRLFGLVHEIECLRTGHQRWGEQLGLVERYAGAIFADYPDARFIHLIRDPHHRNGRRAPGSVGWETAKWLASADLAERNRRAFPERYLVVSFEELCRAPADILRQVCDVAGLTMSQRMVDVLVDGLPARPAVMSDNPFVDRYAERQLVTFGYGTRSGTAGWRYFVVDWPANRTAMAIWQRRRQVVA